MPRSLLRGDSLRKGKMRKVKLTLNEKKLLRRYLVWCYKTTKEELDKVDRYFTQLKADDYILKQLKLVENYTSSTENKDYKSSVDQFETYIKTKELNVLKKKFKDRKCTKLNPDYQYLQCRFTAIEKTIAHFLGDPELNKICLLYEQEMIERILQAREHH